MPPIYNYECGSCKKEYEVLYLLQSSVAKDERKEKCPECKSKKKKRLPASKTSFQLKGKWYKDGY